jgi:hypothetical protein
MNEQTNTITFRRQHSLLIVFHPSICQKISKLWHHHDPIDESMGYSQFSLREMVLVIPNAIYEINNIRQPADICE